MRAVNRIQFLLILALGFPVASSLFGATQPISAPRTEFPNLSFPVDADRARLEAPEQTVTQERMTLPQFRAFFDTVDRGAAVRLVYRNGSEYAGTYSGGDTDKPQIYCRKGMKPVEIVPLDAVTDAYVFVTESHLVRIRRLD